MSEDEVLERMVERAKRESSRGGTGKVGERDDFGTLHAFVLARSERDLGLQG